MKEGFYPSKALLKFTKKPNSYPLPDDYEVITTWGRGKCQNVVKCSIEYENSQPVFIIFYGNQVLRTTQSCTAAATQIQQVKFTIFLIFLCIFALIYNL